ncbi:MAG: putative selenium metabolism hydrolase [Streblomastix strix]|uniref:Putative selenium metabolism hydrolase n=1 Tax=Streblomastix strix TaxID=222440 RepID=A0A5J4X863_9EUKA|nr:MAG: putative selenium metabolism hydrolase [Streblomastix strix]
MTKAAEGQDIKTSQLDRHITELAWKYLPLARETLAEAIRIPADYIDKPVSEGGDPRCGLSNHELPRITYLRQQIVRLGAVSSAEDVDFDGFGNLAWTVEDKDDPTPKDKKKVVYFDGHTDTVNALRSAWKEKVVGADCYNGLVDQKLINRDFLESQLGYLPPESEYKHCIFGRGSADQLAGVIGQIFATKIMLELRSEGALHGVIVRAYGTVAEEDNDGGGPMYVVRKELPGAKPEFIPDAVIFTEGTGCSELGALGIYRGQRGRMQIEVDVIGKSCHGSMPWMGVNPLEFGSRIISEANDRYQHHIGFKEDSFLGGGTRVASDCHLATPSDCAVPERFTFRFDRRLTAGESPEDALADIESLSSVASARAAKCVVNISVPRYSEPTWKGTKPDNSQIYLSWVTPEEHPVIQAAVDAYLRVVTPAIPPLQGERPKWAAPREPRVARWIFSTDGVGFPIPETDNTISVPQEKQWVKTGAYKHPPMLGFGAGYEQNTHKIGEYVDEREVAHSIALYARFPSLLAARAGL